MASPLTGATPILPASPIFSPLTGASAIFTGTPPNQSASPQGNGGAPARPARRAQSTGSGAAGGGAAVRPSGPLRVRALGQATVEARGHRADGRRLELRQAPRAAFPADHVAAADQGATTGGAVARAVRQQLGNALHTALRELRRALGAHDWVRYAAGHYSVNRDRAFDCDVDTFESSLAAAGRVRPASAGLPDLRRAVAAYGGDFLAGMTAGEWASVRRDELRRRYETALLATGRLHAAAGNHQAAVTAFRRAVEHEPLNESAHRELMTSWAALGETARAVRHYTELTALLRDQVGVPPAAETTALHERLTARPPDNPDIS